MALIPRISQTDPDDSRHIPVHYFVAALRQVIFGDATLSQIQAFWNFTPEDSADLATLIAKAPQQTAAQLLFLMRVEDIFMLSEADAPGYDDAGIAQKIGAL